jgi:hypothetical protein
VVRRGEDGPAVTAGARTAVGDSLIGYWVVDVASDDRLIEIADSIVNYAGQVELRPVMDGPPDV